VKTYSDETTFPHSTESAPKFEPIILSSTTFLIELAAKKEDKNEMKNKS